MYDLWRYVCRSPRKAALNSEHSACATARAIISADGCLFSIRMTRILSATRHKLTRILTVIFSLHIFLFHSDSSVTECYRSIWYPTIKIAVLFHRIHKLLFFTYSCKIIFSIDKSFSSAGWANSLQPVQSCHSACLSVNHGGTNHITAILYPACTTKLLQSYDDGTFAAAGPRLWNTLAVQLHNPDIGFHTDCSDNSWRDTFFGKHQRGGLWLLICGALEKHVLTYLLTDELLS